MKLTMSTSCLFASFLFALLATSCDKKSTQDTTQNAAQRTASVPSKHYHLKGKVVSIDKQGKMLNVDSEPIPGFMDAMTMPYKVKPESELNQLHPGDVIAADLLVQDEGAWLENVAITGHSSAPATK
ncbi:MAG: Cytochrome oxidase biosis protein Sco1/SenC/PrrC, putative copper metallochaperone [Acidobacteriaceae bacterium]|jgi:protein SCO1/2|nr:Cytochrome oxidase biosis protein Sco1/SenC/PrrC, putative copper metallochaperone [Acidobacteriaceae bacterium]